VTLLPWTINANPNEKKEFVLNNISKKMLGIAAYRHGLMDKIHLNPNPKVQKEIRNRFKQKWEDIDKFLMNLLPYYMSSKVITHLFVIEKNSWENLIGLYENSDLQSILMNTLSNMYPKLLPSKNGLYLLLKKPSKTRYELLKKNNKLVLEQITPFKDLWILFNFKLGFIEVRTKNESEANNMIRKLCDELRISCNRITFNKNEMINFTNWISDISNSHVRFMQGILSSATYATRKEGKKQFSLKNLDEFLEAREKEKIVSVYAYFPEKVFIEDLQQESSIDDDEEVTNEPIDDENELEDELEKEGNIGFNINFTTGKIYFSTALSEYEVSTIIEKILSILNLEEKRQLVDKPSKQLLFKYDSKTY